LVGLGVVVYGAVSKTPIIGVVGFVVMLAAAVFGMHSYRRSQGAELRVVGGTSPPRKGKGKARSSSRKQSLIDRLEERWRRRPEGDR
ncbi:MAG: DUF3040 domain-containing protein, partial [Micromonosporaceae bacterium]